MKTRTLWGALLAAGVVGCTSAESEPRDAIGDLPPVGVPFRPLATEIDDRLAEPQTLVARGGGGGAIVRVETSLSSGAFGDQLALLGAEIEVHATAPNVLVVDGFQIALGDIVIPTGDGAQLTFTDVRLSTRGSIDVPVQGSGERLQGRAMATLDLQWRLPYGDGRAWPLEPQEIRDVELSIDLEQTDDGTLVADVGARQDGVFFDWVGLVVLSDLRVGATLRD